MSEEEALKRIHLGVTNSELVQKSNVVLCSQWEYEYTQQQVRLSYLQSRIYYEYTQQQVRIRYLQKERWSQYTQQQVRLGYLQTVR